MDVHQSRSVGVIGLDGRCCFPVEICQRKKRVRREMRMLELCLDDVLRIVCGGMEREEGVAGGGAGGAERGRGVVLRGERGGKRRRLQRGAGGIEDGVGWQAQTRLLALSEIVGGRWGRGLGAGIRSSRERTGSGLRGQLLWRGGQERTGWAHERSHERNLGTWPRRPRNRWRCLDADGPRPPA
jgi:hypothetical protein